MNAPYRYSLLSAILVVLAPILLSRIARAAEPTPPDFETEVAPLLIKRCVECHQEPTPAGDLLLTTHEGLLEGGDSGAAIDDDSPVDSFLLQRVVDGDMPPEQQGKPGQLAEQEVEVLRRWFAGGAVWPQGRVLDWFERTTDARAGRDWWSLQPIRQPEVPQLNASTQPTNPIDAFIGLRLKEAQMAPAPPADRRTLLRRLYYNLLGLPPTAEQIETFLADSSPDAWERVVDELLDSPQYGERWARHWLDLARYADTSGYERDQEKPFAWKYRDWVVDAFNSDMPYDRFITEQLAGDELPDRDERTVIATGFLRLGTWNDEPNDPLDYQYDRLEDLIHTTSSAFLGMTVKCARCHSHKFDPITQEDYYRIAAAFWAGPIKSRDRSLLGGPSSEELGYDEVLGWTDLSPNPEPLHLLKNGEREQPLEKVSAGPLSMIPDLDRPFEPPSQETKTSGRRLQLAQWMTDPGNPLPARVFVNRLWLHHFGEGIVRTPNNFGFLANPPTHPELLDWLAAEFIRGDWAVKRIHKLIVTSQTWQQSSVHPRTAEYQERDAGNRLWWRAERRRLDAESLRDSMLAVTGELDLRIGGPAFRPFISEEALEGLSMKSAAWQTSPPDERKRRSLYMYTKRGLLLPMMTTFDLCDATQSCGQRDVTTLPTQALTLLNNRFVHERSETIGRHVSNELSDPTQRVREIWRRVYAREPTDDEQSLALQFLANQTQRFSAQPALDASNRALPASERASLEQPLARRHEIPLPPDGASPTAGELATADELALASLAHVLLNSNEFLYVD